MNEEAPAHPPKTYQPKVKGVDLDWQSRILKSGNTLKTVRKPLNWREYKFPFIYGQADFNLFSHSEWRDCARQALGARDFGALAGDFGDNDDPILLNYIASHSLPQRGIYLEPQNVLVTLGAQNALFLVTEMLVNENTTVALEEPCYPDLASILNQRTSNIRHLPVDDEGMVPDESILKDCDCVFITPSHQCPTTATMPTNRRKKLLELADKHDFVIIEDDYDFEMNFLAAPLPALKTLDTNGRVIYIGSFSKSLFPGLRLGYLVAPHDFIAEARNLRHLMFRHPPGHSQRTAAYFMALGHYSSQMRKLKNSFSKRRQTMTEALKVCGLGNMSAAHFGGSSFWIEGPKGLDSEHLAEELSKRSVLIEPGTPFFSTPESPKNFFRIAYSSIPEEKITPGIELIAATIDQLTKT